jgi:hypothetical protein
MQDGYAGKFSHDHLCRLSFCPDIALITMNYSLKYHTYEAIIFIDVFADLLHPYCILRLIGLSLAGNSLHRDALILLA